MLRSLVGSEMCIRDSPEGVRGIPCTPSACTTTRDFANQACRARAPHLANFLAPLRGAYFDGRRLHEQSTTQWTFHKRTARPAEHQHHSHAVHRRHSASAIRAPGYANGPRTTCLYPLEPRSPFRSSRSDLAQSRSVRAVERSCFDAALVRTSPDEDAGRERRIRDTRTACGDA